VTALLLLLLLVPAQATERVIADRIVAVVDDTPIPASRVAFEAELRQRIAESPDPAVFGRLLTEQVEPLEAVIFEEILRNAPATRALTTVDVDEARARRTAFEATFESAGAARVFLARWGLDRDRLLDRFIDSVRLDTAVDLAITVDVTDEDLRSYYDRNADRVFGGRPFEEVSALVFRQVYALEFEDEYNAWRSRLRSRARKRYVGR
jgi:hypothetical protein